MNEEQGAPTPAEGLSEPEPPHPADHTEQHGRWADGRWGLRIIPRIRRCLDCTCNTRAEALMCLAGRSREETL